MDKKKFLNILYIFLLLVIAIGIRLLYINMPFWYDEACSWFSAKQTFPMGIFDNLLHLDLQHTPLYFLILHVWMKIFGDSEIAIRSLSIIFGIGTVPLVYIVAKKIVPNIVAIFACLVATVSPVLVFFSVEARMYPLAVFMVLLSLNYLIDFEQKNDTKSLVKLVVTNILIPYTLVGAILYNFSLACCYGFYLFKCKKDCFYKYLKGLLCEVVLLLPYFALIIYYAKMRSLFVIKHEGPLLFFHVIDMIRNFFGIIMTPNPYWPEGDPYLITLTFTFLVIVPCVYFVYGYVQGCKLSEKFLKVLYLIFIVNFLLAVILSYAEVFVFTVRYILYLLPPIIILSVYGLYKKISAVHFKVFLGIFILVALVYNVQKLDTIKYLKTQAFKTVRVEADNLKLNEKDIVIMPLGADAPYYFRSKGAPRVFNFDFHKEIRNPYNDNFYDKSQQKLMDKDAKYGVIYDAVFADRCFSENFDQYFMKNVNNTVPVGRYVLLALYGGDANSVVPLEETRKSISSIQDIKNRSLGIMMEKYLNDLDVMLGRNFVLANSFTKGNYTYYLFQKVR